MSCISTWVVGSGRPVAAWVDDPDDGDAVGVLVLAPPVGREHVVAFRALRALATHAAAAGFLVYSFSFTGDGDSQSLHDVPDLPAAWAADLRAVVNEAAARVESQPVHVIGLRLGAAIADMVESPLVASTVLWEPVSGRHFLRAATALRVMTCPDQPVDPEGVELLGLRLTKEQAASLRPLTFRRSSGGGRTLRIDADRERSSKIAEVPPYLSEIPYDAIAEIVGGLPRGAARALSPWSARSEVVLGSGAQAVRETFCVVGPHRLPGVSTSPDNGRPTRLAVVFTPTASETRDGPGGLWARLARELASAGVGSLRVDRRGVGLLVDPGEVSPPNPYTDESVADVAAAIRHARSLFEAPTMGVGLCSGGWVMMRAAGRAPLDEIIAINVVTWNRHFWAWSYWLMRKANAESLVELDEKAHASRIAAPSRLGTLILLAVLRRTQGFAGRVSWFYSAALSTLLGGLGSAVLRGLPRGIRVRFVFGRDEYTTYRLMGGGAVQRWMNFRGGSIHCDVSPVLEHAVFTQQSRSYIRQYVLTQAARSRPLRGRHVDVWGSR